MMWIEYDYVCNENKNIVYHKKLEYNEANLAIAQQEAIEGNYTITEDEEVIGVQPLAINLGGTNAKTAEEACKNIGGINTYTHGSNGLSGMGANGKFKATTSGSVSSIKVNGVNCSVKCGEEAAMDLVAGCWYTFIREGNVINFNSGSGGGAGGTLTVTAPAGVTASVSKDGKIKTKIVGSDGIAVFKGLKTGTWTLGITDGVQTFTKSVKITTDYNEVISFNAIPEFTYTGDYEIVNDSDEPITVSQDNWKIRFLTSGSLTFTNLNGASGGIDLFLVGGGGGGGTKYSGGGGGGYTNTIKNISVNVNQKYQISVGAGGARASSGGKSSAFEITANGGNGAVDGDNAGANGGSGGGSYEGNGAGGNGGSNGGNGGGLTYGKGQGTTTREFGGNSSTLYSGGGGGGKQGVGGGKGGTGGGADANKSASANTGGGGGGGSWSASIETPGGTGGSGIVIIRNKR